MESGKNELISFRDAMAKFQEVPGKCSGVTVRGDTLSFNMKLKDRDIFNKDGVHLQAESTKNYTLQLDPKQVYLKMQDISTISTPYTLFGMLQTGAIKAYTEDGMPLRPRQTESTYVGTGHSDIIFTDTAGERYSCITQAQKKIVPPPLLLKPKSLENAVPTPQIASNPVANNLYETARPAKPVMEEEKKVEPAATNIAYNPYKTVHKPRTTPVPPHPGLPRLGDSTAEKHNKKEGMGMGK